MSALPAEYNGYYVLLYWCLNCGVVAVEFFLLFIYFCFALFCGCLVVCLLGNACFIGFRAYSDVSCKIDSLRVFLYARL